MEIKRAIVADAVPLTKLTIRSKAFWGYSDQQILDWNEDLTITEDYIKNRPVYKLVKDNILVGFYAFKSLNDLGTKLNFLFIDPKYIGKGYGDVLIKDFFQRIIKLGYNSCTLDADPNATLFYEKYGFKEVGRLQSSIEGRYLPIMYKDMTNVKPY